MENETLETDKLDIPEPTKKRKSKKYDMKVCVVHERGNPTMIDKRCETLEQALNEVSKKLKSGSRIVSAVIPA